MTTPKYPPPVKINPPEPPKRKSNAIYKWFQHQQGVESLEHRIALLEAELRDSKEALKERRELLETIRVEVLWTTITKKAKQ
ncbi:MAG: hypothetical protein ACXAC5_04155 [Promethearchaeota archaeon]|jgi:hypothetical protein